MSNDKIVGDVLQNVEKSIDTLYNSLRIHIKGLDWERQNTE